MKNFDVIIIGGGLAGLSTAAHLIESNSELQILVIDAKNIGDGASGVPAGIVNPVTGQNARIVWKAETSLKLIEKRLETLSKYTEYPLYFENGILRPAIDDKLYDSFKSVLINNQWAKAWYKWLDPEAIEQQLPFLKATNGGLFLRKGKVIRTPEYLDAFVKYLREKGVHFKFFGNFHLQPSDNKWILKNRVNAISALKVIVSSGFKSRENRFWNDLPINSVKGQLAIYHCYKRVDSYPAVSAYGYTAPLATHQLAMGSTYEHHFHDEKPDGQGAGHLDQKLKELMPGLYPKCQRIGQWTGIRATTSDRMPIVGEHPEHKGLYVFTGLGSKGLLYSEHVGSLLAGHLLQHTNLPEEISLYRFSNFREMKINATGVS